MHFVNADGKHDEIKVSANSSRNLPLLRGRGCQRFKYGLKGNWSNPHKELIGVENIYCMF